MRPWTSVDVMLDIFRTASFRNFLKRHEMLLLRRCRACPQGKLSEDFRQEAGTMTSAVSGGLIGWQSLRWHCDSSEHPSSNWLGSFCASLPAPLITTHPYYSTGEIISLFIIFICHRFSILHPALSPPPLLPPAKSPTCKIIQRHICSFPVT